jgi:hypothetical protein
MTTALPDANYAVVSTSSSATSRLATFTETSTTFRVRFTGITDTDANPTEIAVMVIR